MNPIFLHDKAEIERFLRRDPALHLYELGDLDPFFWPYTTWVAGRGYTDREYTESRDTADGQIQALFLIYTGGGLPVLLAIAEGADRQPMRSLLEASRFLLPRRFYSHFSPGLADVIQDGGYRLESHGSLRKMALLEPQALEGVDTRSVVPLTPRDEPALRALYNVAYPDNWFDPRMLETGCYYGVWEDGQILSVAGVHVYSPQYGAAALGNITTHPGRRGQGLGKRVTARLCRELLKTCAHVGLNVRDGNAPALAAYRKLGFREIAEYEEYMVET